MEVIGFLTVFLFLSKFIKVGVRNMFEWIHELKLNSWTAIFSNCYILMYKIKPKFQIKICYSFTLASQIILASCHDKINRLQLIFSVKIWIFSWLLVPQFLFHFFWWNIIPTRLQMSATWLYFIKLYTESYFGSYCIFHGLTELFFLWNLNYHVFFFWLQY